MKKIGIIFIFIVHVLQLAAQQTYSIVGFAGKDTLHLGTTSLLPSGKLSLDTGDYQGLIQLRPVSADYQYIALHLDLIKAIHSEASFNAAKAYIRDTLPFETLYHSGMWKEYVQQWVGFYAKSTKSAEEFTSVFVPVAKQVLDRTVATNHKVSVALVQDLIEFFEQYGLQTAAENIAAYSMGFDFGSQHSEAASRLLTASKLIGHPAPPIAGVPVSGRSIVIFHEIGCSNCELQIKELKLHYAELQQNGYSIISIAGENNKQIFETVTADFPWKDKICESGNFEGESFKRYGVISTPTLYVTDSNGNVQGRYARLEDTGLVTGR